MFSNFIKFWRAQRNVLGIDARDLLYVPKNSKHAVYLADSKLASKRVLKEHNLPSSRVFAVIHNRQELKDFDWNTLPSSFVLKPNRGMGGAGIVVAFRKKGDYWLCAGGKKFDIEGLQTHIINIFDGLFSLFHQKDIAFFEERISIDNYLKQFSYKGIPDIRIWLYNYIPVMAMLRLPSAASGGKANLAQGGIGVGLDLSTGQGIHAIVKGNVIIDTIKIRKSELSIHSIRIPKWKKILKLSIETAKACKIKFTGLDVAIDKKIGPLILEVNARPGLEIQNANMSSLKDRLQRVANLKKISTEKALNIGISLFGGSVEQEIELLAGKEIIGLKNEIEIFDGDNIIAKVVARVDSSNLQTVVDRDLAMKTGLKEALEIFKEFSDTCPCYDQVKIDRWSKDVMKKVKDKTDLIEDVKIINSKHGLVARPVCRIKLRISETDFTVSALIMSRRQAAHKVVLGQDALKYFLFDVNKKDN